VLDFYDRLRRVKCYVMSHYPDGDVSLVMAASIACLEPKYFSKYFHKKVGVSYKSWVRAVRISAATTLMESNECSITELAYQVGFSDLGTFERAFKKQTGMSPKQFQEASLPKSTTEKDDLSLKIH